MVTIVGVAYLAARSTYYVRLTYNVKNLFRAVAHGAEHPAFRDASEWDEEAYYRKLAAVADAL